MGAGLEGDPASPGGGAAGAPDPAAAILVTFLPSGRVLRVGRGSTVFDAVRGAGLPLGSSCDGDALCGWCRVRILDGGDALSAPGDEERRLLTRRHAEPDERIACLAHILGPITVTTTYW